MLEKQNKQKRPNTKYDVLSQNYSAFKKLTVKLVVILNEPRGENRRAGYPSVMSACSPQQSSIDLQ